MGRARLNLIKKILKEDQEWFEDIVNEYDDSSPDFILKLINHQLKGKKSLQNREYLAGKEKGIDGVVYYIAEITEGGELSYFISEDINYFNLKSIEKYITQSITSRSKFVSAEYKKLYNDLKPLFIV